MKKFFKKVIGAALIASVLITGSAMTPSAAGSSFTVSGGWNETAYAEWPATLAASDYSVFYKLTGRPDAEYSQVDSELVRINKKTGNCRVDIPGL